MQNKLSCLLPHRKYLLHIRCTHCNFQLHFVELLLLVWPQGRPWPGPPLGRPAGTRPWANVGPTPAEPKGGWQGVTKACKMSSRKEKTTHQRHIFGSIKNCLFWQNKIIWKIGHASNILELEEGGFEWGCSSKLTRASHSFAKSVIGHVKFLRLHELDRLIVKCN